MEGVFIQTGQSGPKGRPGTAPSESSLISSSRASLGKLFRCCFSAPLSVKRIRTAMASRDYSIMTEP